MTTTELTVTKSDLLAVPTQHFAGQHQMIRMRELVSVLDDTYNYTLNDLMSCIPDNYVSIRNMEASWYDRSDPTTKNLTRKEYASSFVKLSGYAMDFCYMFMLAQIDRGEVFKECPHCNTNVHLNLSTNTTTRALEGQRETYGLCLEIKCPHCGGKWHRLATEFDNPIPVTKITANDFARAVADLESIPTKPITKNRSLQQVRLNDLKQIAQVLAERAIEEHDAFDLSAINRLSTRVPDMSWSLRLPRDIALAFKIALLNRNGRTHTCPACSRTTPITPSLCILIHDATTYCTFKCPTCNTIYVWTIWGYYSNQLRKGEIR